ncbi:MAG TPA: bifunctional diaminohydroxyphosphoribosylaminopyrimidine deaminase/5-amino-6-(5-phosphoribosylamino)uracil reductase RibD [Planctomycetaceae bacterium]|nr:bifunctional diaminohydroxyphosphoribosylaminopyrimidine deaminase/5-amino-6-(5-phosphoribosylamino)uracil reductase RibD [Planctomycetaceae bacterium]
MSDDAPLTTHHATPARPVEFADDASAMRRALALAARGIGHVEPNPPVGAVILDDQRRLAGEGWHQRFGGPHAELEALTEAGDAARGATLFVTLEPCCHVGKTPPCTRAVIDAGVRRVVFAASDPAPHNAGRGAAELRAAGIEVEQGLLADASRKLIAPFLKGVATGLPWVHAKWAMTLDGRIASRSGHSRWISNERSRQIVHQLRGRMDAILVGAGTVRTDDPLLTARPPGPRTPVRIILDTSASLPLDSQLVRTLEQAPVLVACSESAPAENVRRLEAAGVEVLALASEPSTLSPQPSTLVPLLAEFGRRRMTNVLVEGGARVLGAFFDAGLIDEVHVFIAPRIAGGAAAPPPLGGRGLAEIPQEGQLEPPTVEFVDGDIYVHGRVRDRRAER